MLDCADLHFMLEISNNAKLQQTGGIVLVITDKKPLIILLKINSLFFKSSTFFKIDDIYFNCS